MGSKISAAGQKNGAPQNKKAVRVSEAGTVDFGKSLFLPLDWDIHRVELQMQLIAHTWVEFRCV